MTTDEAAAELRWRMWNRDGKLVVGALARWESRGINRLIRIGHVAMVLTPAGILQAREDADAMQGRRAGVPKKKKILGDGER